MSRHSVLFGKSFWAGENNIAGIEIKFDWEISNFTESLSKSG
jgi:hypothetical protein